MNKFINATLLASSISFASFSVLATDQAATIDNLKPTAQKYLMFFNKTKQALDQVIQYRQQRQTLASGDLIRSFDMEKHYTKTEMQEFATNFNSVNRLVNDLESSVPVLQSMLQHSIQVTDELQSLMNQSLDDKVVYELLESREVFKNNILKFENLKSMLSPEQKAAMSSFETLEQKYISSQKSYDDVSAVSSNYLKANHQGLYEWAKSQELALRAALNIAKEDAETLGYLKHNMLNFAKCMEAKELFNRYEKGSPIDIALCKTVQL